jgi:DnaK suppressor protein
MNIEHFKKRLEDKRRELESILATLEGEGRDSGEAEVRDATDDATTSQATSESFAESTVLSQTLEQVRDALDRIRTGTFGKCVDCGRPIEPARLEAIPWTPYCLAHQEKHDRAASAN